MDTPRYWKIQLPELIINREMIPIKIAYFLNAFGALMLFPFFNLQALSIGITLSDISIISILQPLISILANPLIGYCADRFGHKQVLVTTVILYAIFGTLIDQTPRYREYQNSPFVELNKNNQVKSFSWPTCTDQDTGFCKNSSAVHDFLARGSWLQSIDSDCASGKISIPKQDSHYQSRTIKLINGTFCNIDYSDIDDTNKTKNCSVAITEDSLGIGDCQYTVGNHAATFGVYLVLRLVVNLAMNICFSLMDGTNLRYAQKFNGDFAKSMAFGSLGSLAASALSGFLVIDAEPGSGEENYYQNIYYTVDAIVVLLAGWIIWKIQIIPSEEEKASVVSVVREIASPIFALFNFTLFIYGVLYSLTNFYLIYAQDVLGAESSMIGIAQGFQFGIGIVVAPIANAIVGPLIEPYNMICCSFALYGIRMFLYAFITHTPPYQLYYLALFDIINATLFGVAYLNYASRIAPKNYFATVTSLGGAMQWMLGAGVGGLISGQLTGSAGWSFPFLFNMAGFTSIACAIFFFVNYHTWGKKNEKIVAEYFKDYSRDQKIDSRTLKVTDLERSQMEGHGRF